MATAKTRTGTIDPGSVRLRFPEPGAPLAPTHLAPFDWALWMEEIEKARRAWLRTQATKPAANADPPWVRFQLE